MLVHLRSCCTKLLADRLDADYNSYETSGNCHIASMACLWGEMGRINNFIVSTLLLGY
jgi:hypothetical protein